MPDILPPVGYAGVVVRLLVAPELRFLLPARHRSGVIDLADDPTATLGHVVQAAGIPLTEVGALLLDGHPTDPSARAVGTVDVRPAERPQPLDGPPRLLLDVHLGALARRLRLLGLDTAYRNDATDAQLVVEATAEDRLLLSKDRGLLRRRGVRRGAYVRGDLVEDQLDDVLDRFRLPLAPFARCPACNGLLAPVDKAAVLDRLEPGTRRTQERFWQCQACGQVYWRGAHAARLDAMVARYAQR